ncbi:SCO family protein [Methyloterricola oryzae]|uniref:SCO family protein n=1 Tax=Methyloterricola oryzae TaxID=1495050 RepID=UPI0005EAFF5B|nr:SCO family protein [Methyloterricola oryzae]
MKPQISASTRTLILALLAGLAAILEGGPAWAADSGSSWGANFFPNVELIDQDGRKLRFYDDLLKGKVFALNFIFTRCKDSCPAETAALRKVQKALGDRVGREVFFYTISIDGERDKPEELKAYADKFHVGPGWLFLSGGKADVDLIRKKLGMYRNDGKQETALNQHSINILLGNEAASQWIKRSPFEDTAALVRVIGQRLGSPGSASGIANAHINAPILDPTKELPGEKLFYPRCSNCHSVSTAEADDIGPGLAGITKKRDRNWLKRWLKEPDKLIAKKDKTALAIYKAYKQIPMPNFRLTDQQAEDLVQYLEANDRQTKPLAANDAKALSMQ